MKAAKEIVVLFPSETADTYFIPYNSGRQGFRKAPARGKLWSRYLNVRAALRIASAGKSKPESKENTYHEENTFEDEIVFLKNAVEPFTKILQSWENSHSYRLKAYKNESLDKIFDDFPCLKQDYGIELVHACILFC